MPPTSSSDLWYVRLPDGRILRAKSTQALRRYFASGQLPWDSRVRRSPDAPWVTVEETPELADLLPNETRAEPEPAETTASRKPRATGDLRTLGLRGLVDELFNAFDSSLQHAKLVASGLTGLAIGVSLVLASVAFQLVSPEWTWLAYVAIGAVLLLLFCICTSILTQMTALELTRFQPAHFSEVRARIAGHTLRLFCTLGLLSGLLIGVIVLLRLLPGWMAPAEGNEPNVVMGTLLTIVAGARLIIEVLCWPILGIAMLLMGPILVVEEHSIWGGLREWLDMLRQHLGRIYLYQAIAFTFAFFLTMPLLVPIVLALTPIGGPARDLTLGETVAFYLLFGIALTPMLNYLLVAHVFIYLNLRYEFFYSVRER